MRAQTARYSPDRHTPRADAVMAESGCADTEGHGWLGECARTVLAEDPRASTRTLGRRLAAVWRAHLATAQAERAAAARP